MPTTNNAPTNTNETTDANEQPTTVLESPTWKDKYQEIPEDVGEKLVHRFNKVQYHPSDAMIVFRGRAIATLSDHNELNNFRDNCKTMQDADRIQIKVDKKTFPVTLDRFTAEHFVILKDPSGNVEVFLRVTGTEPTADDRVYLTNVVAENYSSFWYDVVDPKFKDRNDKFFEHTNEERKTEFLSAVNTISRAKFVKNLTTIDPKKCTEEDETLYTKRYSSSDEYKGNPTQQIETSVPFRAKPTAKKRSAPDPDDAEPSPDALVPADPFFDIMVKPWGYTIEVDTRSLNKSTTQIVKSETEVEIQTELKANVERTDVVNMPKQMRYDEKQLLDKMTMTKFTNAGNLILVVLGDNAKVYNKDAPNNGFKLNVTVPKEARSTFVPTDIDEPESAMGSVTNMVVS